MNGSGDDFDTELRGLFRQEHRHLANDPFVGITARRIRGIRRRRTYLKHALQAVGLAVLVLGSHWLIDASAIVSTTLNAWFVVGLDWLAAPLGTIAVSVAVIAVVTTRRWKSHWRG